MILVLTIKEEEEEVKCAIKKLLTWTSKTCQTAQCGYEPVSHVQRLHCLHRDSKWFELR